MVYVLIDYILLFFFFFKQKTAYEMRISDWSSDVCFFRSDSGMVYPSVKKGGVYETIVSFKQVKKQAYPLEISMKTGPASSEPMLEVHYTTAEDPRPRALQIHRFIMPWVENIFAKELSVIQERPELAGEIGSASCRERVVQSV